MDSQAIQRIFLAILAKYYDKDAAVDLSAFSDDVILPVGDICIVADAIVTRTSERKKSGQITCVVEMISGSFSGLGVSVAGKIPDAGVCSLVIQPNASDEVIRGVLQSLSSEQASSVLVVTRVLDASRNESIQKFLRLLSAAYPRSTCGVVTVVTTVPIDKQAQWGSLMTYVTSA